MEIIGIGIDLQEIKPFEQHFEKQNKRFFQRVFTEDEIAYCERKPHPAQHYTARFCAKEAAVKALSSILDKPLMTDFEIFKEGEKPMLRIKKNLKKYGTLLDGVYFMLSLSHAEKYAIAQVLVYRR